MTGFFGEATIAVSVLNMVIAAMAVIVPVGVALFGFLWAFLRSLRVEMKSVEVSIREAEVKRAETDLEVARLQVELRNLTERTAEKFEQIARLLE